MSGQHTSDVLVIGGGIAGYACAIANSRLGLHTTVIEQAAGAGGDVFGFVLWPRASRVLRWLGVAEQAQADGAVLESMLWKVLQRPRVSFDVGRAVAPEGHFLGIRPSRLVAVLREAAVSAGATLVTCDPSWQLTGKAGGWQVDGRTAQGPFTARAPLLVGADGPRSQIRDHLGLKARAWQPRGQVIISGIGGGLPFREARQLLGPGVSWGCASLGAEHSWLYAVAQQKDVTDPMGMVREYCLHDEECAAAYEGLSRVVTVRPAGMRVPRWSTDGALVLGDAAHATLPQLGFGVSLTLEDVPLAAEVLHESLRSGDLSAARLAQFRTRREAQARYLQRISESWARLSSDTSPRLHLVRDASLRRTVRQPAVLTSVYRDIATSRIPALPARVRTGLV